MRLVPSVLLVLALPLDAQPPDAHDIVVRSVRKDNVNSLRAKDYTFVEEKVTTEKDRQGRVTKTESITFDVLMIGDRPFRKKIAQDGKSLPEKEARKVEAEFEKALKKHEARQASGRPDSG